MGKVCIILGAVLATTILLLVQGEPGNPCFQCYIKCSDETTKNCKQITTSDCPPATHYVGNPNCGCCKTCYQYLNETDPCNPTCGPKCGSNLICNPTLRTCAKS